MPGLVKKLLIFAAVDGLLLHPSGSNDGTSLLIPYGNVNKIRRVQQKSQSEDADTLESPGIIGILNLVTRSYLIAITRKSEVARIRGMPIYEVKDVALIPLANHTEARDDIVQRVKRAQAEERDTFGHIIPHADHESDGYATDDSFDLHDKSSTTSESSEANRTTTNITKKIPVLQSIVQDKGRYGRFAENWFSKGGWTTSERRRLGLTSSPTNGDKTISDTALPASSRNASESPEKTSEGSVKDIASVAHDDVGSIITLTPRIVRATQLYFSSGGFYFSYDHDLSRSLALQESTDLSSPLYKRFQPHFFWNRYLLQSFIVAKEEQYVLPLIQGFVGQYAFSAAKHTTSKLPGVSDNADKANDHASKDSQFLLTLISRRSTLRPGLRYLRRGIDQQGNAANSVETEQLLSPSLTNPTLPTYSLLQIRGSIPLFFSQSPYSFKPTPMQYGSEETNLQGITKHFETVQRRYGPVQVVSLVDTHGTEASIGTAYQTYVEQLQMKESPVSLTAFEWFDFHSVCKGMNFGKVQVLLDTLQEKLKQINFTMESAGKITRRQAGVLRVNCMDCLDRTNVVQSAVGAWALQTQLTEMGMSIDLQNDPSTRWFNVLWADNGDNISKQYAGTAALKGDFTRTRERKWTGALSDFSLTMTRYYNNIFGDSFLQTCIDYYLGNTNASSFSEFQTEMTTKNLTLDVGRIRQDAIQRSVKLVLTSPDEHLIAGHVLASPHEANTLRTLPFEECVVLLTEFALYHVRVDWDTEKISGFERVDLRDIRKVQRGAYITSVLEATHTDQQRNYGLAISYVPASGLIRANTRSLANEAEPASNVTSQTGGSEIVPRVLAFKALPAQSKAVKREDDHNQPMSEVEMVKHFCRDIARAVNLVSADLQAEDSAGDSKTITKQVVEVLEKDVISLEEATKSTGLIETLGYSLKKLVFS